MKSILLLIFMAFVATSFGAPTPYQNKDEEIVNKKVIKLAEGAGIVGDTNGKASAGAGNGSEGLNFLKMARVEYDVTGGDSGAVGAHSLGVALPAGSIIFQSMFYIDTAFVDSGAGTVALHCEDANNIYSAADITGISTGVFTNGIQVGFDDVSTVSSGIAAACNITATVATAAQDSGKLTLFVLYGVHD